MSTAYQVIDKESAMNQQIAELAEQMNVSYNDVLAMATGIVAGMEQDKVADFYLANESERLVMCEVYMAAHVRKVDHMMVTYFANPECAQLVHQAVFAGLTQ